MSESAAADAAMTEMLNGSAPAGADLDTPGQSLVDDEEGQEPIPVEEQLSAIQDELRQARRANAALRVQLRDAKKQPTTEVPPEASTQALTAAKEQGRNEARLEYGVQLAAAEIKAALAGVMTEEQIADVVDDLNLSRFVDDEGQVDKDAVKVLRDKFTSIVGKRSTPSVSNGRQTRATPTKNTADQFADALGAAFR